MNLLVDNQLDGQDVIMNKKLLRSGKRINIFSPEKHLDEWLQMQIECRYDYNQRRRSLSYHTKPRKDKKVAFPQENNKLQIVDPEEILPHKNRASISWKKYQTQPFQLSFSPLQKQTFTKPTSKLNQEQRKSNINQSFISTKQEKLVYDIIDKDGKWPIIKSILKKYKGQFQTEEQTDSPCIRSVQLRQRNTNGVTRPPKIQLREKQTPKIRNLQYCKKMKYVEENNRSMLARMAKDLSSQISPWFTMDCY